MIKETLKESLLQTWLFVSIILFLVALIVGSYSSMEIKHIMMYVLLVTEFSSIAAMFFLYKYNKKRNG